MAGGEQGRFDGLVACEVPILLAGGVADEGQLAHDLIRHHWIT